MGRFKLGFYLGGLFGAGLIWLNFTKEGRRLRDELLDHAAVVYARLKEQVFASPEWKKLTKNQYVEMAREAVDRYAVQTGIADEVKKLLLKVVNLQWDRIRAELDERTDKKTDA